jgi:hypothetical protein
VAVFDSRISIFHFRKKVVIDKPQGPVFLIMARKEKGMNTMFMPVKGIFNTVLKNDGTVNLTLGTKD